ncbi:cold-regulated protein 27-like [Zingiber officinale]|uniref:cold-regulated protein 27-like n=1 Tax=Zingiber officinale TaxID=94328 RepID=UPI001C4BE26E|nr:cold-regulated protein 27-like [Zingiber officinale]
MGDSSSNRPNAEEISKMGSPSMDSRLVDSLSKGWTDEKHTLFLNSIESSFVNELHNGEYNSKAFLGWISRTNVHKGSCRPYETDLKPDQFKVLRKGCWENLVYDRDKKNAQIEVDSFPLSANPWIKHFRSPWITSEKNLKSSDRIRDSEFTRPSLHVASEGHYGEGTSIKQNYSQNLDGDSEEVSDQNFLDDVPVSWKRSSIIGRKRKLGAAVVHDSINEQLTPSRNPSLMPTSDGNHTPPHATTSESSRRTSEVIASTLLSDSKEALRDDKEVIS